MSEPKEKASWRYLAVGALFAWLAGYMLLTGELPVDKQKTMVVTRASDPLIYWPVLLVCTALALACLRKLWKAITAS
jgi:hypothetical protein